MKNPVPRLESSKVEPRHIAIVERTDGTWNLMEGDPKELRAYRPKKNERVRHYRAFVRNQ